MHTIMKRQAPYTLQRPHIRDFWEIIVRNDFTVVLWVQFRMTCLTFDEVCNKIGPFMTPTISCHATQMREMCFHLIFFFEILLCQIV